MNIAVIHEVGYLSKPVYEYQDFAERLAYLGHSVTVIDFDESIASPLVIKKTTKTGIASVTLVTLPNIGLPLINVLYARYRFGIEFKKILEKCDVDAVFLYSIFVNGIDAVKITKKLGIRVVFRAIDAYHRLRKNPWQSWLLKKGESFVYKNVNLLAVTNHRMDQYVRNISGLTCAEAVMLNHGVDTTHFRRVAVNEELANHLGISASDFVAVFLGTTYLFSQLDSLIEIIPDITKQIPNFKFLIIGSGELDSSISKKVLALDLGQRVICCGMIDYLHLPDYLSLAKLAILPFQINSITRDIIPIKLPQYLSSSLPVISTPLSDVMAHFPPMTSGVIYSPTDQVSDFMRTLLATVQSENLDQLSISAREFVSINYSMNAATDRLERILSGC